MKYRSLGTSGIVVSEIGFGGWGIGGATPGSTSYGPTDDNESQRALRTAFDLGINYYDTAGVYGHSEKLIGKTFKYRRDRVVISTKVGFLEYRAPQNFSKENIIATLQRSLENLETDYIDLYQLHNPDLQKLPMDEIINALIELRTRGLIRAFGVSTKHPDHGLIALGYEEFASIQVNLSMIDQRALSNGLISEASDARVGIIARTPLCFGFLTGTIKDLDFSPQDHRSLWPMEQLKLWLNASELFSRLSKEYDCTLTQFALRFCLDTPGVSTVIPGMLTVSDVLDNVSASEVFPLDQVMINRICKLYQENNQFFYRSTSQ